MTTPIPRFQVAAPAVTPLKYTLLGAAADVEEITGVASPPGAWERGVEYYSTRCNRTTGFIEGWCPDGGIQKDITPYAPVRVEAPPFTVYTGSECQSPVFPASDESADQLERSEDLQVERLFWLKVQARPDLIDGGTASLIDAFSWLEEQAAIRYAGQAWIHVSPRGLNHLAREDLVANPGADAGQLRTAWGSRLVPASGYAAAADAPATGPITFLATGEVTYRRSDPFTHEYFDPKLNEKGAVTERTYVIASDCLALKVQATPCDCAGG